MVGKRDQLLVDEDYQSIDLKILIIFTMVLGTPLADADKYAYVGSIIIMDNIGETYPSHQGSYT